MDIRMPRLNGIAAIAQLLAAHPSVKVIVLSVNSERIFASAMLSAGARGYVTKSDAEELPRAIRAVMNDLEYRSLEVSAPLAAPARGDNPVDGAS
jgi:DNA-binding NarL/FixJ family response regulator